MNPEQEREAAEKSWVVNAYAHRYEPRDAYIAGWLACARSRAGAVSNAHPAPVEPAKQEPAKGEAGGPRFVRLDHKNYVAPYVREVIRWTPAGNPIVRRADYGGGVVTGTEVVTCPGEWEPAPEPVGVKASTDTLDKPTRGLIDYLVEWLSPTGEPFDLKRICAAYREARK